MAQTTLDKPGSLFNVEMGSSNGQSLSGNELTIAGAACVVLLQRAQGQER